MLRDLLMTPFAWLFGALVLAKNMLYDCGLLKVARLPAPVISVGNLAMGGTGKTPVTMDLARRAIARGLRVGLLSRGYGRRNPKVALRVDPEGDWRDYGDEPMMIARRFPEALVAVGPSRLAAAGSLDGEPIDLFILDDGFQHRQLHRDLDLVLINVSKGRPRLFPRGLFREGLGSLKRADTVVLTKWDQPDDLNRWLSLVSAINPEIAVTGVEVTEPRLFSLDGAPLSFAELRDQPIGAFAGIAEPDPFFTLLAEQGLSPIETLALRDHQPFTGEVAIRFERRCAEAGIRWIVTTEKDAVKLERGAGSAILIAFLAIGIQWKEEEHIVSLLDRAINDAKERT